LRSFFVTPLTLAMVLWSSLPAAVPLPSVAVTGFSAGKGVDPQTARVLTEAVVHRARASGAFSRVAASSELEAVLDMERQRQLLDCNAASCVAEIAGALGVDLLLTGSVALLGDLYVVNMRLLAARSGEARASFLGNLKAGNEAVLLEAVNRGTDQVLVQAGLNAPQKANAAPRVLMGAGVVALVGAGTALVLGACLVAAGAAIKLLYNQVYISGAGRLITQVQVGYVGAALAGALLVVLAAAGAAGGAGALVTAWVVP
jgi:TolB-like protein